MWARCDKGSLIITSQVPVDRWHDLIGIPTLADAKISLRTFLLGYQLFRCGGALHSARQRRVRQGGRKPGHVGAK